MRWCLGLSLFASLAAPRPLLACAACFGKSDANLARGMNWGILSLLFVVLFVLGGIATFFVYLGKRAQAARPAESPEPMTEPAWANRSEP